MKIFSGTSNLPLASKVAEKLNLSLSPIEFFTFPDKEKRIRIEEKIVDEDVVIIQSTSSPADTSYMELFFLIDAAKRSGARSITVVIPYMGYQRQDHVFRSGEAVSLQVVIETLERLGVTKVIAMDLHSIKIPEFFKIPHVHLSAIPLFAEIIKKEYKNENSIIVSPDMGGIRRIEQLSQLLDNLPTSQVNKNRNLETGDVSAENLSGEDVNGKAVFMLDDMMATGKTLIEATKLVITRGASRVVVFATHPILSHNASSELDRSEIEKIYTTDSIYTPEEKKFSKLEIISVADVIANSLK